VVSSTSDPARDGPASRECALCGGRAHPWLTKRGHEHLRCERCDSGFLAPESWPRDLATLYGSEYFEGGRDCGYPGYLRDARLLDANFDRRLAWIESLRGRGRLLEVGCAYGLFLRRARERGWDVAGVEIAADCAEQASANAGVSVVAGDFMSVDLPGGFDVVVLLDVIEHLPDPGACIARCAELLGDDGLLVIETGDLASVWARLLGRRWHFVDPPQHLFYFTARSLDALLRRHGFAGPLHRCKPGRQVSLANIAFKLAGGAAGPLLRMPGSLFLNLRDGMLVAAERSSPGGGA
jgi:SAM-dependent methyltransferase